MKKITIFWLRRDLRLHDNTGLYQALANGSYPVLPLFIFDNHILSRLQNPADARVGFIHHHLLKIRKELADIGVPLLVRQGAVEEVWQGILDEYPVGAVYTNQDYEPYARQRDHRIQTLLAQKGIPFHTYKDHLIFENLEVAKKDGKPYTVFTPYSRAWLHRLHAQPHPDYLSEYLAPQPSQKFSHRYWRAALLPMPTLADVGFRPSSIPIPSMGIPQSVIRQYDRTRDYPALPQGTSRLGIHYRFGTISIRQKALAAARLNATYLNELIWRDFYAMILANFPHVATQPFRSKYKHIEWLNNEEDFKKWCEGKTGYPLVDAGMRQLNATGYMHNRVRMVVASFLCKHLLINWQWGEAYFAEKLLDFDLASNNGGWQWAAGCGTDAAPYFRIFNPITQQKRFDPKETYIRQWLPEYGTEQYPSPIIDHKMARQRCLQTFKEALSREV